jgi:1-acyl-sn-glycerol-3-phosphate acyltransferase
MLMPRPLRRILLAPAVLVLALLMVTTLPVWLIVAALVAPRLPGRLRALRILSFLIVVLVTEAVTIIMLAVLWVAGGFRARARSPRSSAAHYALMRGYLAVLFWSARRVFNLDFVVDASEARTTALDVAAALHEGEQLDAVVVRRSIAASLRRLGTRIFRRGGHPVSVGGFRVTEDDRRAPLLVFSRHAGPGDSLLLVHALLQQQFRPHIVLRDALQWVPAIDIGLNRLPNLFVGRVASTGRRRAGRKLDQDAQSQRAGVARLAAGLVPGDALVLFPEGRNFTPRRRLSSIARLEERGDHAAAEFAREMRHVLMPRSGGASAAVAAARGAEIVFVAHTGLEDLSSFVDLWRGTPMDASIRVKLWRVNAQEIPTDDEEAARWLLRWWTRIDAWILEHHGRDALPDAVVTAIEEQRATDGDHIDRGAGDVDEAPGRPGPD